MNNPRSKPFSGRLLAVFALLLGLPHAASAAQTYQPQLNTNLCLDLAGGVAKPGAYVQVARCSGGNAQAWTLQDGTLQALGLCLDVPSNRQTNGTLLQVWNCLPNDAAQQWTYTGQNLQLTGTNFCVDVPSGNASDGQRLQIWNCGGGNKNQVFSQGGGSQPSAPSQPAPAPASSAGRRMVFQNNCSQQVWVALQNNGGQPIPSPSGIALQPGASGEVDLSSTWGGRMWGRTGCHVSGDSATCDSGDCGGRLACGGIGGQPSSLVEFLFNGWAGSNATQDYYDISLVDAFNLPVGITPMGGQGLCHAPVCRANILTQCRSDLQVKNAQGQVVTCLSECSRYQSDPTCCRGANGTPSTCPRPPGQQVVKNACPDAYSYAYDDGTSTWNCTNPSGYTVTFCP